jgi:hypothetical protein
VVSSDVKTRIKTYRRPIARATAAVISLTAAGAVLDTLDPALAGQTLPHPTLTGSVGDAAGILANNARVLAAPFVAITLGFQDSSYGRRAGDALTLLVVGTSALPVGIAIAHWGTSLLPYIPQLPVEWAALATAVSAWLASRHGAVDIASTARRGLATAALLIVAAGLETWCTPHRDGKSGASTAKADTIREPVSDADGRVVACATDSCAGEARSLQGRTLPSPHSVRFRSASMAGAYRATSTTRPPQGGITE